MNLERRLSHLGSLFLFALLLLSLRIVYWQLLRGEELQPVVLDPVQAAAVYGGPQEEQAFGFEDLPQPVIQRTVDLLETITRGTIYDRDGRVLAEDRLNEEGERIRFYTEPSLAHTLGYVSGLRTGVSGLEASYNDTLLGLDRLDSQVDRALNRPFSGSDLHLTIDSALQRAAERELAGSSGAIVVLDAGSGAIRAIASAPHFDPNRVLDQAYITGLLSNCGDDPLCRSPFLNRASQALYPPGSTFKTVTLIAALDTGQVTPETVFDFGQPIEGPNGPYYIYTVDGGIIPDPNHRESRLDLAMSYAKSANAAFARMGDEMPPDIFLDYAARFGFTGPGERTFALEFESSPALVANDPEELVENNLLRAASAIGQGELLTSPLNMGMVVLSIVNGGNLPVPYLVESIEQPSGALQSRLQNRQRVRGLMERETAEQVREMMVYTVEQGSGATAGIPGVEVGGKTGTAQVGEARRPHSWFTGFADDGERAVVIVVMLEYGGGGSVTATPIFARLAALALEPESGPVEEIVPTPVPPAPAPPEEEQGAAGEEQGPAVQSLDPAGPEAESAFPGVPPPDILRDPGLGELVSGPTCPVSPEGPLGSGEFIWPSQYQALSGTDFEPGHPGIDLSIPLGVPVYAADSGVVIFAGWTGIGYGNAVLIEHGNGYQTLYGHLSQVSIICGAGVEKGQLLGLSGETGNSSGPHLHFEVRVPGGYLNPLKVLPLP